MFRTDQMGVYIHWPFCAAKCPYCDFNSHVREVVDQKIWAQAYVTALGHYAKIIPDKQVVSIFFGGGTPSLMEPEAVETIIDAVQRLWAISNDVEITLEANPTSVEAAKFQGFRRAGVNRISLGVQAFNDEDLQFLGREHSADQALRAIDIAGEVFDRYSFDLIYARPDQTLSQWEAELRRAAPYMRGHLSAYQLTIERTTPFYMRYNRGEFAIPDDILGADFYNLTQDVMEELGMLAYEVSNHASKDQECRHNLIYWNYADYIGVGPGAHGRFMIGNEKRSTRDHSAPEAWLACVNKNSHGSHPFEIIQPKDRFSEILMMGLRMREGININKIESLSGCNFDEYINAQNLGAAINEGWISKNYIEKGEEKRISLTREGLLRLNSLIPFILL